MKRWKVWLGIVALAVFAIAIYLHNRPLPRTVIVGSDVIELTVRGNRPGQTVAVAGPMGSIEYGIQGDKVTTVKRQLAGGAIIFHVYRYSEDSWSRLTTEHRPGGWPGSIRRYYEDTGDLPSGYGE